jgi:hypothetical protein
MRSTWPFGATQLIERPFALRPTQFFDRRAGQPLELRGSSVFTASVLRLPADVRNEGARVGRVYARLRNERNAVCVAPPHLGVSVLLTGMPRSELAPSDIYRPAPDLYAHPTAMDGIRAVRLAPTLCGL